MAKLIINKYDLLYRSKKVELVEFFCLKVICRFLISMMNLCYFSKVD